jgi:hypothetical protein
MAYRLVITEEIHKVETIKYVFIGGLFLIAIYLFYIYRNEPFVNDIKKNEHQNKNIH